MNHRHDANPLDMSPAVNELVNSCRTGNLARAQELIYAGVNVNARDKFDYTPLLAIDSSVAGEPGEPAPLTHDPGARAERNTFQGERCIYAALTDKIRNLLLKHDFSKSTDQLIYWSAHITSLLARTRPATSDVTLHVTSSSLSSTALSVAPHPLHRFILATRSEELASRLHADLSSSTLHLHHLDVPPASVRLFLRFLYLVDMSLDPSSLVFPGEDLYDSEIILRGAETLADQLGLRDRLKPLLPQTTTTTTAGNNIETGATAGAAITAAIAATDRFVLRQQQEAEVHRALAQMRAFFRDKIMGGRVTIEADKADTVTWTLANPAFADVVLRADHPCASDDTAAVQPLVPMTTMAARQTMDEKRPTGGETHQTDQETGNHVSPRPKCVLYPAHKAMLIRSPYFETMFSSAFAEAQPSQTLRVVKVDCAPEVLEMVLAWLYTERAEVSLEWALDLLYAADMLLMEPLKNRVATVISTLGSRKQSQNHGVEGSDMDDANRSRYGSLGDANGQGAFAVTSCYSHFRSSSPVPEYSEPINIYDVIHAAWELHVPKLETFAARYLADRLEDYIDDADFSDLISVSASRVRARQKTDTIELLDDIRYYLSERFRQRFHDTGLRQVVEELQAHVWREREVEETEEAKETKEVDEANEADEADEAKTRGGVRLGKTEIAEKKDEDAKRAKGDSEFRLGMQEEDGGAKTGDSKITQKKKEEKKTGEKSASEEGDATAMAAENSGDENNDNDDDNDDDKAVLRAFDGQTVADELDLEEKNYLYLLGKIEDVLERLDLDA